MWYPPAAKFVAHQHLATPESKYGFSLIGASLADESGNLVYRGTTNNFNPMMATAADLVIAEAKEIVPVGDIKPEHVHTPALFVDYLVQA